MRHVAVGLLVGERADGGRMNPYLQAMLMRVSQGAAPGQDQVIRSGGRMPLRTLYGGDDLGIYGPPGGLGGLGGAGNPVMPPNTMSSPGDRQLPLARNVMQDTQRGLDPVLTGSGFEMTPAQIAGAPSSLDMLQQYLRQPQAPGNMLGSLYSQGFGQ